MKRCAGCKVEKTAQEFYKDNRRPDKLTVYCRSCTKTKNKASKTKNQEYVRRTGRTYMAARRAQPGYRERERTSYLRRASDRKNWPVMIWQATKLRAKQRGQTFEIEVSDIIIPERCPIFGVVLERRSGANAPSIDRIDSKLGYVKGNIAIISNRANTVKNSGSAEEHQLIADWMRRCRVD